MLRKTFLFLTCLYLYGYAQSYGLTERTENSSLLISLSGINELDPQRVFSGISFQNPLFLTHAPDNSDRIFVVEKAGRIKVFANDPDVSTSTIFLDLVSQIDTGEEGGLLGLAFHPDYASNGRFYVYYTDLTFTSVISEFTVSADADIADPASERIIMQVPQTAENHNAGMMAFGPDQMLYVGFGDGGGSGDPLENAQDRTIILGSIIRINVDVQDPGLEYAIPSDNPYAGNNNGWREEIWAYGLRNPWRFSFDNLTGKLYCADVGQDAYEEIDIIEKGNNYGWNIMEGFHCYSPANGCDGTGLTEPIYEYDHSLGMSVTGGYVYRGDFLTGMDGAYIYGDYVTRKIWALRYENGTVTENREVAECPDRISSFGIDQQGEIYVVGYVNSRIYKLRNSSTPAVNTVPNSVSSSGLFSDISTKTLSDGLIPYDVNTSFWSDGSIKERILALPGTQQMVFDQDSIWDFPNESILVKNFYVEMEDNNPASKKIIETRFMVKHSSGTLWSGYSYQWAEDESDAFLLNDGLTRNLTIVNPDSPGGSWTRQYYYPSPNECLSCHASSMGYVLGVKTSQINCDRLYENGVTDNQLRSYNNIELFTEDIGEDYSGFPIQQDPTNTLNSLDARARSYLETNCSFCHRPGGSGRGEIDLRYDTDILLTNTINTEPLFGDMNIEGAKIITPGNPANSILYLRMVNHGAYRMPRLATNYVDTEGSALIHQWISELGGDITLPVKLLKESFKANIKKANVLLEWQTSSESEVLHFELYRRIKSDKINTYTEIGQPATKGSPAFGAAYSFVDHLPDLSKQDTLNISYFLYEKAIDGSSEFLAQTTINILPVAFEFFNPFPNPTNSSSLTRFFTNQPAALSWQVYNTRGSELFRGHRVFPRGEHRLNLDLKDLNSGLYFIKLNLKSSQKADSKTFKILLLK